jgi:hypothetical protein
MTDMIRARSRSAGSGRWALAISGMRKADEGDARRRPTCVEVLFLLRRRARQNQHPTPPTTMTHLLRLPHEDLVNLLVRLPASALSCLAATCRLLQYGKSSPQTPNPLEVALWRLARLRGWSQTLQVDPRGAVKCLLRLAWQDELKSVSISASRFHPVSLFVDLGDVMQHTH